MKRWVEFGIFSTIAALLHVALFAAAPQDGSDAGGAGGKAIVTIAAATPTMAEMVDAWEQPTQAPPVVDTELDTPDQPVDTAPTPPAMDIAQAPRAEVKLDLVRPETETLDIETQPATSFVQTPTPQLEQLDSLRPPLPQAPQSPRIEQVERPKTPRPQTQLALQQPTEVQPLEVETAPSEPKPKVKPKPKPKPKQQAPKTKAKAKQNIAGRAGQKAAGSGGSSQAGSSSRSQTATISKGQRKKLQAVWGAKIRSRIERRKRYPSGTNAKASVVVQLFVSRDGRLQSVRVARSSGVAALDQAALQAVKRAGRFPAAPKKLPGNVFPLTLRLDYSR